MPATGSDERREGAAFWPTGSLWPSVFGWAWLKAGFSDDPAQFLDREHVKGRSCSMIGPFVRLPELVNNENLPEDTVAQPPNYPAIVPTIRVALPLRRELSRWPVLPGARAPAA